MNTEKLTGGVKERGIPFSAPMVRAILDGRKTQTRRILYPQPQKSKNGYWNEWRHKGILISDQNGSWCPFAKGFPTALKDMPWLCPYGRTGERLWVRETWGTTPEWDGIKPVNLPIDGTDDMPACTIFYRADDVPTRTVARWRPSIHMPRRASRITLELTGVRVERLQEISDADAKAEGVGSHNMGSYTNSSVLQPMPKEWREAPDEERWSPKWYAEGNPIMVSHSTKRNFINTWERINGPDSWEANPWVWVLEFQRVR